MKAVKLNSEEEVKTHWYEGFNSVEPCFWGLRGERCDYAYLLCFLDHLLPHHEKLISLELTVNEHRASPGKVIVV